MTSQINVQPQVLDLMLYSGDGIKIKLTCRNTVGGLIDVTGSVAAQIRVDRNHPDDPPLVSFTVDLTDAYLGVVKLSLTGDQTESLMEDTSVRNGKFTGVWDVEWDPATDEPRTLCQGTVECVADVTR